MKVKRLVITPELVFSYLTPGLHEGIASYEVENGLPPETELVNCRYVWPMNIELLLRNDAWPDVPTGEEIPQLMPLFKRL